MTVLDSLAALCSKAEYCTSDIYTKALRRLEGDAGKAQAIVDKLQAEGFIDDSRYCQAFFREKSMLTGWGPVKIRYALRAKGIDGSVIDAAMREAAGEEAVAQKADSKLLALLAARRKALQGDPQIKLKLIKYALGRGYEYSQVEKALKEFAD